jgi:hypothetical protein
MSLLRDIHRRNPAAFSGHARARLRDIADSPRRVIRAGGYDEIIRQDETLRLALHDLLRDLG